MYPDTGMIHLLTYSHVDSQELGMYMLSRKTVADAFWNAELEAELRSRGWLSKPFMEKSSRETLMSEVDSCRASETYPHNECSQLCKDRGWSLLQCVGVLLSKYCHIGVFPWRFQVLRVVSTMLIVVPMSHCLAKLCVKNTAKLPHF